MKKTLLIVIFLFLVFIPVFASDLTDEEIAGILLMREEEKLARDVYTALYEEWGIKSFLNIAQSEQTHFETIGDQLIDAFGLEDPVKEDVPGVFSSPELQELYDMLIEKGAASVEGAIEVGLTIEDLDMYDLQSLIDSTDNQIIEKVYESLQMGSANHMEAFYNQAEKYDFEYQLQYISQEQYEAIKDGKPVPPNNMNTVQNRNENQNQNQECEDCETEQNTHQNENQNQYNDNGSNNGNGNSDNGNNGGNGNKGNK